MNPIETELDKDAVNLAKSIRQVESGGNFQSRGKSGEYGGYQFTQPTWDAYSKEAGVNVPLEQATPEQQNEVAYKKIKQWKDQGKNIGEIASMWNAGEGKPNAYLEGNSGVNDKGVHYDTAAYANNVADTYHIFKNQGSTNQNSGYKTQPVFSPKPIESASTEQSQEIAPNTESLGSQIRSRVGDISTAISDSSSGKQGITSGLIQTVGAVGGAVGDVASKALELIPGVKWIEKVIGSGVGKLAQTETGQAIVKSIQDFSQQHPELSKNIGAGINIVSAIPMLRGIGVVKNAVLDTASLALKNAAEKAATKDITSTVSRTIGGRNALARSPNAVKTLVEERALPEIIEGKYTTKEASDKLSQSISEIEEELQTQLGRANLPETSSRVPLAKYRREAMQDAIDQLKDTGPVENYFDRLRTKYGDYPTLQQMNDAKRIVSQNISEAGFANPNYSTDKVVRSALQKSVEEGAATLGLEDVAEINQRMARLIKAQNILEYMQDKPVKTGFIGGIVKNAATAGGEALGNTAGIPLAGAYLSNKAGGFVGKKFGSISKGILSRTGKGAERQTLAGSVKKTKGLIKGVAAQKATKD